MAGLSACRPSGRASYYHYNPRISWDVDKSVFSRMVDGVEPDIVDKILQVATRVEKVRYVAEVRVRWLEHRLHAEVNIAVNSLLFC
ncbi:MAG TPA: hypothetical protein VN373_01470 [Methanosarcina barkeri]|nr:hypothetical protein [Methanosarcina barkeri]